MNDFTFEGNPDENTNTTTNNTDPFADQLKAITNESGEQKYKDLPTALEALKASQEYIPTLRQELEAAKSQIEELRVANQSAANTEDVVQQLLERMENQSDTTPINTGITEDRVAELLNQTLSQREQKSVAEGNAKKVAQVLNDKYGTQTKEVVAKKAEELGTTVAELGELAARNPNMVLAYFNTVAPVSPAPSTSSVNTTSQMTKPREKGVLPEKPEKSLLAGATSAEQAAYMQEIKKAIYEKYDVEV